jgi:Mn2+/Fe2+ NRAMP family transporter
MGRRRAAPWFGPAFVAAIACADPGNFATNAMATDLAEIICGALALYMLFGMPLAIGGLITCVVAFALLAV